MATEDTEDTKGVWMTSMIGPRTLHGYSERALVLGVTGSFPRP